MVLINGKCYDWNSITIHVSGMENIEFTSITYGDKQDFEAIYGAGGDIKGYGTGNKSNTVNVEMSRENFDEYCNVLKKKGVKDFYKYIIPKITISYADEGAPTSTDVLTNVKLGNRDTGAKQGDKSVTMKMDGTAIGGITWNGMK